jgi:hypothetical protein
MALRISLFAAIVVVVQAAWLLAMGRPLICPCGEIALFVSDVNSAETSQQVADWYSLSHIIFGFVLHAILRSAKPSWSTGQALLVALASSAVWEAVENLPWIIATFGDLSGAPPYHGDSALNSLADTGFVAVGFALSSQISRRATLLSAFAMEGVVLTMTNDGYLLAGLRVAGLYS